jgi:hypothetical protein
MEYIFGTRSGNKAIQMYKKSGGDTGNSIEDSPFVALTNRESLLIPTQRPFHHDIRLLLIA